MDFIDVELRSKITRQTSAYLFSPAAENVPARNARAFIYGSASVYYTNLSHAKQTTQFKFLIIFKRLFEQL